MIDLKPSINFWHDFKSNQLAGMWLFLGSRRSLQIVHPSILQLIVWGVLGGCTNSLYSWLVAGQIGDFNSQGLIGYALLAFLLRLLLVFSYHSVLISRVLMLVPALLWLVLDTNILLIQCLIQYLGSNGYLNFIPDAIYNGILPGLFVALFVWQVWRSFGCSHVSLSGLGGSGHWLWLRPLRPWWFGNFQ